MGGHTTPTANDITRQYPWRSHGLTYYAPVGGDQSNSNPAAVLGSVDWAVPDNSVLA